MKLWIILALFLALSSGFVRGPSCPCTSGTQVNVTSSGKFTKTYPGSGTFQGCVATSNNATYFVSATTQGQGLRPKDASHPGEAGMDWHEASGNRVCIQPPPQLSGDN